MAFSTLRMRRVEQDQTPEEFKTWLAEYDKDGDGKISAEELRAAIRARGSWFSKTKTNRVLGAVDKNSNGLIDEHEIHMLMIFAAKQLGFKIVSRN